MSKNYLKEFKNISRNQWILFTVLALLVTSILLFQFSHTESTYINKKTIDEFRHVNTLTHSIEYDFLKYYTVMDSTEFEENIDSLLRKDLNELEKSKLNTDDAKWLSLSSEAINYNSSIDEFIDFIKSRKNKSNLKSELDKKAENISESSDILMTNYILSSNKKVRETERIELLITALTLFIVFVIMLVSIRPSLNRIKKLVGALTSSNKELQKATSEIERKEARFKTIAELSPVGLFLTDPEGKCMYVNKKYSEISGLSYEKCMGDGWSYAIYEEDRNRIYKSWNESVKSNEQLFEDKYRVKEGNTFKTVEVKSKPLRNSKGKLTGFIGITNDITKTVEKEDELKKFLAQYEVLLNGLELGSVFVDDNGNLAINEIASKITGFKQNESLTLHSWFKKLYKDKANEIRKAYQKDKDNNFQSSRIVEFKNLNGEEKIVLFKGEKTEFGEVWGLNDLTEVRKTESELEESKQRHSRLFEIMKQGVVYQDADGQIIECNSASEEILGLSYDQMISKKSIDPDWKTIHEDGEPYPGEEHPAMRALKTGEVIENDIMGVYHPKEQKWKWINIHSIPLFHEGEDKPYQVYTTFEDITEIKEYENEKKELNEKYSLILNKSKVGVWDWHIDTDELFWDNIMYEIFGIDKSEDDNSLSKFVDALTFDTKEDTLKKLDRTIATPGDEFTWEFKIFNKELNETRVIKALSNTYRNENGNAYRMVGINYDITDERKIEEELQKSEFRFNAMFDLIPDLMLRVNYDGVILDYKGDEEKFTIPINQFIGKSINELKMNPKVQDKLVEAIKETIKTGVVKTVEYELPIQSGDIRHWEARLLKVNENEIITIIRDITEKVNYNKSILSEKDKAEEANKAKSIFLANMSHEIRTPMNAILGFSDILKTKISDSGLNDYLIGIQKSARTLLDLINDILELTKIEADKIVIRQTPTNLNSLIEDVNYIFKEAAAQKGIEFRYTLPDNLPEYIQIDPLKIKQILINVIGNAIKFTSKGFVRLIVEFEYETEDDSLIRLNIKIEDTGIGIPSNKLDSIFEPFKQVDSGINRKFDGTGLGLSITSNLVKAMNGNINVSSKEGKGTSFNIEFPNVSVSIAHAAFESEWTLDSIDSNNLDGNTILIAEDIKSNREVMEGYLKKSGLNVIFVENGKDAIKQAKKIKPDAVFMDLQMPVMDGFKAIEEWRNDAEIKNIPVVALTAKVNFNENDNLDKFDAYLSKPVSVSTFYDTLSRFIKIKTNKANNIKKPNKNLISEQDLELIKSKKLNGELQNLLNVMNMKDIQSFSKKVAEISEEDSGLRVFSDNLNAAVSTFNINKIRKILED